MTNRRFWRILLLVVFGALALRVGYVLVAKRTEDVLGDQIWYNDMANQIARGNGFTDPRDGSQQAEHPPLVPIVLTPTTWVAEEISAGGRHLLPQRLTMAVIGAGVVLLIGLVGRTVAGDRAGLIAAVIAAIYPNLWINDALVMSETLAALSVALAILFAYRLIREPKPANAAWLGVACGLAMLTRAELGLLLPVMVLPVVLLLKLLPFARQVLLFLVACAVALAVVSPWLVANLTRFQETTFFSTNDGLTICGANLDGVYYGDGTGLWSIECADHPVPKGDRSVTSNALRSEGLHYIRTHLSRVPAVVGVRIARVWSLYAPGQMAAYNTGEGRDREVSWAGFFAFWALVPCAVVGAVKLRRRRVPITPLVAQFVMVTITAAAIYGLVRFRVPAEVSLVVLAAVAIDAWWHRGKAAEPDDAARPVAVEASA
jgi:4-amino-4-deoxy-L-arabinose transferase-like glycosyltransferase